jgi:hypothetical protein
MFYSISCRLPFSIFFRFHSAQTGQPEFAIVRNAVDGRDSGGTRMMRSRWQLVIGMTALALVGALIWADRNVAPTPSETEPVAMSSTWCEPAPAFTVAEPEAPCVATQPVIPATLSMALPPLAPQTPVESVPTVTTLPMLVARPEPSPPVNATNPLVEIMTDLPAPKPPPMRDCEDTPVVAPPATSEPPLVNSSEGGGVGRNTETVEPTMLTPVRIDGGIAPRAPDSNAPPTFPWRFTMESSGGRTQFELRRGEESLLRVQCEALDFSSPGGGLVARGKVVVTGPCLEARCERLTLAWQSGEVALDGGVQLSVRHEGLVQLMRAEALTFRLGGPNQTVEFTSRDVQIQVQPKP